MNSQLLRSISVFIILLSLFSLSFGSPATDAATNIVDQIMDAFQGSSLGLGVSFLLLTMLFTVIFKQATVRMLPNHSNGATAVAVILAIFVAIGLLANMDSDNYLGDIGKNIAFPLLLLALFAGSWAVLRGISNAQVSGFAKFLLYIGFFVLFLFAFLQILGFGAGTFLVGDSDPGSGTSFIDGVFRFFAALLLFIAVIFIALLLFFFFTLDSFFDIFDDDNNDSALSRSRSKKRKKKEEDANTVENLAQVKKAFHKMRTAYDDKEELLKEIARMEPVQSTLNDASEVPSQVAYGRGKF